MSTVTSGLVWVSARSGGNLLSIMNKVKLIEQNSSTKNPKPYTTAMVFNLGSNPNVEKI